jgi:hypothetical protein
MLACWWTNEVKSKKEKVKREEEPPAILAVGEPSRGCLYFCLLLFYFFLSLGVFFIHLP